MGAKKKSAPPPPKRKKRKKSTAIISAHSMSVRAVHRTMMLYIRQPGVTLREVWDQGRMSEETDADYIKDHIALATLQVHSADTGWVAKRDEFWKDVRADVFAAAKSEAVKEEIEELETLTGLRAIALVNITGMTQQNEKTGETEWKIAPIAPKSMEGLVNAFIRLDKHISDKRAIVMGITARAAGGTLKAGGTAEQIPDIEDNMSDSEYAMIAHQLAVQRAGMQATDREEEGEE